MFLIECFLLWKKPIFDYKGNKIIADWRILTYLSAIFMYFSEKKPLCQICNSTPANIRICNPKLNIPKKLCNRGCASTPGHRDATPNPTLQGVAQSSVGAHLRRASVAISSPSGGARCARTLGYRAVTPSASFAPDKPSLGDMRIKPVEGVSKGIYWTTVGFLLVKYR